MADPDTPADATAEDPDELRAALIDQLRYLIDEIRTLKGIVDIVPEPVREGRPTPDALTMKEIYGVIARMDERVYRPRIERIIEEDEAPAFEPVEDRALAQDEDWNDMPIEDILERVQAARAALVAALEDLPAAAWERTGRFGDAEWNVYEVVHHIIQEDTRRLRTLSYRLHETNLTDRDRDLPK